MLDNFKIYKMKKTLLFNLILIITTISIFAQENNAGNYNTNKTEDAKKSKNEVVVNKKLIAKYEKFMSDGEYVSLWETVKDYNFNDMSGYYKIYKNYEFTDDTTYPDIKMAYEKEKGDINLAEDSIPLENEKKTELLTKIQ